MAFKKGDKTNLIGLLGSMDESNLSVRFGKWTQIGPSFLVMGDNGRRSRFTVAQCECGRVKLVLASGLANGKNTRCRSCASREMNTKHGLSRTHEYRCWTAMMARCTSPKHKWFCYYGGRGIRVCDEWAASCESFIKYMGPAPTPQHEVDRIDSDGNYEPGNVRWATKKENIQNRKYTQRFDYRGSVYTLRQASDAFGVPYKRLRSRVSHGWSLQEALETPEGEDRKSQQQKENEVYADIAS